MKSVIQLIGNPLHNYFNICRFQLKYLIVKINSKSPDVIIMEHEREIQ